MDTLWAPWRLGYVVSPKDKPAPEPAGPDCFLCRVAADDPARDRDNLVVGRTGRSVAVLNRFPYNNGHLLIAPVAHKGGLVDLAPEELHEGVDLLRHWCEIIGRVMNPQGYNVGLNLGKAAGAGLPGHLHWHVVPRWEGDTNFMPSLAATRVIVQSLEAAWDALTGAAK